MRVHSILLCVLLLTLAIYAHALTVAELRQLIQARRSGASEAAGSQTTTTTPKVDLFDSLSDSLLNVNEDDHEEEDHLESFEPTSDAMWPESRCTNVQGALNVRSGPSPSASIVKTIGPETKVTVYEVANAADGSKWARIATGQWVSAKFLKMACANSNPSTPPPPSNNDSNSKKAEESLVQIFRSEGKCQNWASDSGNSFQGKIGYTCMGVIPSQCWNNRNGIFAPLLGGFNGHPADFCKYAYDKNTVVFKQCAAQLYIQNYFGPGGCNPLPMPAFYVCADIAVNSGTGRSRQYIAELGGYHGQDAKQFARALNEKHRADYKRWGCPTCKNRVFLKGWLARADERDRFIDRY
ncbi:hypothetical protein C9374_002860 [Naegleria lovaniensis]|uniref:SH3b domain-containing protein n=1 Tax=Naegleria lovaniensis TaxID=51637 RepID=A0AA88GUI8_NAELO|nr:uncharacterized protein C9374_002860 [Naegleria lovaniensis]KAG2386414.1 hypothetical protein C9374_002860 [Naegleria lovaniensis]